MLCVRSSRHALRRLAPSGRPGGQPSSRPSSQVRAFVTDADVEQARAYCVGQLRQGDYDAHLVSHFVPRGVRDAYLALRTLNLELARLPETVSNATLGHMRMQFWKDAVDQTLDGRPPREPVSLLLYAALAARAARAAAASPGTSPGTSAGPAASRQDGSSLRFWLRRLVDTRQQHMDDRPFASLAALETYAENTYASLLYATLALRPLQSMHVDHLASHVGKACGIVAVLRGIPVLAAPRVGTHAGAGARQPVLLLPLDVMADAGLREEDVFRQGPDAPALQDAVFRVATRANDHLITAREMLRNLRAGHDAGHAYEHAGDGGHAYGDSSAGDDVQQALQRGIGVLLDAVPAQDFLARLEAANFDAFRVRGSWKLPWSLYRAQKTQRI